MVRSAETDQHAPGEAAIVTKNRARTEFAGRALTFSHNAFMPVGILFGLPYCLKPTM